jgi:hypothetical protein
MLTFSTIQNTTSAIFKSEEGNVPQFLLWNVFSHKMYIFWMSVKDLFQNDTFKNTSRKMKFYIFSNGGHLGYRTALMDKILKGDHLRIISAKFGWNWLCSFREDFFKTSSPLFSNLNNRSPSAPFCIQDGCHY